MPTRNLAWRLRIPLVAAITVLLLTAFPSELSAVPANPRAVTLTQPDGAQVTLYLRGDERHHWHQDKDGYLAGRDPKTRFWQYAVQEGNTLRLTGKVVGRADPKAAGLSKVDPAQMRALAAQSPLRQTSPAAAGVVTAPTTGTMRNLVLLVNFSDLTISSSNQEFDDLFNQTGYATDGAVGSVKDFYAEVSYDQLTVQSTVTGPVTLDNGYAHYGANSGGEDIRPREMVQEALAKLADTGFDFSTMDGDADGWVDGLTIIHAGGGEEYGGNDTDYIWSHEWELASPVTYNGVKLQLYHTEPARRGWDSYPGTQGITRIGVICHESGHFLGLPDLYDYDYDSAGAGEFCLMAGGAWNGDNGTSPAHMSAWCKATLGWVTPTVISAPGAFSLDQAETAAQSYKLRGGFPANEYFLIENRQGAGFDAALPGSLRGILIWHVDENQPNNDDQTHYLVDLEEASGMQHLQLSAGAGGDDLDYYRSGNATSFGPSTVPSTSSYYGATLGLSVTGVGATGATMNFNIADPAATTTTTAPTSTTTSSTTTSSTTSTSTTDTGSTTTTTAGPTTTTTSGSTTTTTLPPTVTLSYPSDSGILLHRKTKCELLWTSAGMTAKDKVNIWLVRDSIGGPWPLARGVASRKGSWQWKVGDWKKSKLYPAGYPNGDDFRIRIVKVNKDKTEDAGVESLSDSPFAIGD